MGWKPLASVRWHWVHAVTKVSNRSCAKAWKSCRWPSKTCRCCPKNTSTCAAPATTTDLKRSLSMLPNPTLDKLQTLRLHGMIKALSEQHATPDINDLSFDERLGLMVDRELTEREDIRLTTRLKAARLRDNACLEDIDYRSPRGLDKALILQLGSGQWLRDGLNLIIGGPTGVGKTWLA
ncbi:ISPsy14, transposition helper protein, partial [Pseudomonas tremae]